MSRRALFVAPSAYLLSGLATWLDYLIPGLREAGWDARLGLVSGRRHHRPKSYLDAHPCSHVEVAHCRTDTAIGRRRALCRMLARVQPDVVVSVNIPDLYPAVVDYRRRGGATACAMSVHGIEAYLYGDMRLYRDVIGGVICTNRLACALAYSLGGTDPRKVLYAPYGISMSGRAKNSTDSSRLRLVYSGRLETDQKRSLDLVEIVREIRRRGVPFQLDVLGDGPDKPALGALLQEFVDDGTVRFHGFVSEQALRERFYPSADAIVVTSSWETGPIVIWEAMAHGVSVVSSRYIGSGLESALEHGRNALLFDVGDTAAAAANVERLWRQQCLREAVSIGGRELLTRRYNTASSVAAWSKALSAVCHAPVMSGPRLPDVPLQGRLDRWLGTNVAESVRAIWPRDPIAPDPGGEWPHSHSRAISDGHFWELARVEDKPPCEDDSVAGVG